MSTSQNPIGIFDSGIGGLTVAHAVSKILPDEQIIYFGDTAHLPYGDKSKDAIKDFIDRVCSYFIGRGCKAMVVACNTASAYGFPHIEKLYGDKIQLLNVIDPMIALLSENYYEANVGVIGTKGTINSRVYARKVKQQSPGTKLSSQATPLLAPMIEEGYYNNYISKTIINSYLVKKSFKNIEALILGCTHYPLIKKEIAEFYQREIQILDSSQITAKALKLLLESKGILSESRVKEDEFFVSDYTSSFEHATKQFFGKEIKLRKKKLNKLA